MSSNFKTALEITSIISGLVALVLVIGISYEKKADAVEVNAMNVRLSVLESKVDEVKVIVQEIRADQKKNPAP